MTATQSADEVLHQSEVKSKLLKINTMGQYTTYGIIDSFDISKKSLDRDIKNKIWGKTLDDYGSDIVINQMPTHIYDVSEDDNFIRFKLKDPINMNDLANLVESFFEILPYSSPDDVNEIVSFIRKSDYETVKSISKSREYYNFVDFHLYGVWHRVSVKIDGQEFCPQTDVDGIMLFQSCDKTTTEDPISTYDFFTELLRYRLKSNPLSDSMICYLSQ